MTGWQAAVLSVSFIIGTVIQGLIVLNNPIYAFVRWHGTLLVWAVAMFCVLFNTVGAKVLPIVQIVVCTLHFLGLFAVLIPLWIFSSRATPSEALLTFTNGGGWPTTGLSAMIGLLAPVGSLFGFDSVVHMCSYHPSLYMSTILTLEAAEEVEDAGRTLPKSIMYSVYLNGAMGFLMAMTLCFCLGDLAAIVDTPTGYPFIQVFYNATQSYTATNILVAIFIINLTACCVSTLATASRQLWSFARDKGVPFSCWFAQVRIRTSNRPSPLILHAGLPYYARPRSCDCRLRGCHLPRVLDQHWFDHCPQRYGLPLHSSWVEFVLYLDRLCGLEAFGGSTIATPAMVSW